MPAQTSMLHVRVDDDIKLQAARALAETGLTVSDAVRLFLKRVVADQGYPLDLKVPNAQTRAAMAEAEKITRTRRARFATGEALMTELVKSRRK